MSTATAWQLGLAPLRNSVRAVVYTRRGPDRAQRLPPVRFLVKAGIVAAVFVGGPLVTSGAIAGALRGLGQTPEALAALGWTVLSVLAVVFGFVAAIGMSLPRALVVDEFLLALPVARRTYVCAKLLALELEGLFWALLLGYPAVLQSMAIQRAAPATQAAAIAASVLQYVWMASVGIALAHAVFVLRPATRRLRLLVRSMMILVAGGGLGVVGVAAQAMNGGALSAADALARLPFSPTGLPLRAVAAVEAGSPAAALAAYALLVASAATALAAAFALMTSSHARICFLEEQ